jgi:hypothetical protein
MGVKLMGRGMGEWWLPSRATEFMGIKLGSGTNDLNLKKIILLRSAVF